MGQYFNTVLKPRVMKAIYAEKWKNAKPVSRESRLSHIIKYQRIESYEDALNNIEFTERENSLFEENLLSYLLGSETRESPTFLNIAELQNPFSYQLNIVNGLQTQTQIVDLPETFNYLLGISVQTRRCLYDDDRRYPHLPRHSRTKSRCHYLARDQRLDRTRLGTRLPLHSGKRTN